MNPTTSPSPIPYLHISTSDEALCIPTLLLDDILDSLHHSSCPGWFFTRILTELPSPAGSHPPPLGAHTLLSHGSQWGSAEGNQRPIKQPRRVKPEWVWQ